MMRSNIYLMGAVSAVAIAMAGSALAQAARPTATAPAAVRPATGTPAAPAPAAITLPQGPAITGLCVYSREQTVGQSAVGKYVNQRLQQLQQAAQAEVSADQQALATDAKAFEARRSTLSQDAAQQQELGLQQRDAAWQRKAEIRSRELQATAEKAYSRVLGEANPLVAQVYGQQHCSVLLDGQSVMAANSAMNITSDVVHLLDAKITQFPFEREHLEQQAQATPAATQR
jgi:outer membrane protein